jgi:hypothetical protein
MSYSPQFHGLIQDKIQIELDAQKEALARRCATDFADYTQRCGVVQGLELALTLAELSKKQMLES